jgi:hypothetical protein
MGGRPNPTRPTLIDLDNGRGGGPHPHHPSPYLDLDASLVTFYNQYISRPLPMYRQLNMDRVSIYSIETHVQELTWEGEGEGPYHHTTPSPPSFMYLKNTSNPLHKACINTRPFSQTKTMTRKT